MIVNSLRRHLCKFIFMKGKPKRAERKCVLCFIVEIFDDISLSSILKLNLPILSDKSSDFLGDRGRRMRGRCIASTFATKSIIDSTRTHRAMNPDGTTFRPLSSLFQPPLLLVAARSWPVWNFNKISEIPILFHAHIRACHCIRTEPIKRTDAFGIWQFCFRRGQIT